MYYYDANFSVHWFKYYIISSVICVGMMRFGHENFFMEANRFSNLLEVVSIIMEFVIDK